jgi:RNA polymerase primary sigma factor
MRDFKILHRITNTSDNINRYFSEISKYEVLTPEKEAELALKSRNGDKKAKELILKSNLRFVVSVAKAYQSASVPLEDLISEGNKGLVEAIELFDPSTGFKFISYAVWHIRKNIFVYLNNHSRSIRIPTNINQEMRKYQSIEGSFISHNGREPSIEEMIEIIENPDNNITISKSAIETIKSNPVSVSLEGGNSSNEDETFSPIGWLSSQDTTDSNILDEDFKKLINSVLSELSVTERTVVMLKYGIGEYEEPASHIFIGEKFGKTPEWSRLVLKKAERRIYSIIRRRKIKNLLFDK